DERRDLRGGGEAAGGKAADAGDDGLACGLSVGAGRGRDRLGDAVLAEPQIGLDRARRDAVDADAPRAELLRERLAEVHQCRLGRAVVDGPGVGLEAVTRSRPSSASVVRAPATTRAPS